MATQEDRLATVERKVAALELRRLYDERKAEESTPSALGVNLREMNENMTILLGIASGQEQNIKEMAGDIATIKERSERVEQCLDRIETSLVQILERLPKP